MVVIKKILPMFKYDEVKDEKYQFALTSSFKNLWVTNLIGHLRANGLTDLL
jgi:hypothetical protein